MIDETRAVRPQDWLEGEIELTALALTNPDCDIRAVLGGFAALVLRAHQDERETIKLRALNEDVPLSAAELDELQRRIVEDDPTIRPMTRHWAGIAIQQLRTDVQAKDAAYTKLLTELEQAARVLRSGAEDRMKYSGQWTTQEQVAIDLATRFEAVLETTPQETS